MGDRFDFEANRSLAPQRTRHSGVLLNTNGKTRWLLGLPLCILRPVEWFSGVINCTRDDIQAGVIFQQHKKLSSHPTYNVRRLTMNDERRVLDFMNKYFRDEPISVAVNLFETPDSRCKELDDFISTCLSSGVSVAAIDENDNFIGLLVSEILRRKDPHFVDRSSKCANPKFRRILQVTDHLEREARMWDVVPPSCDTVLMLHKGASHTAWRRSGLIAAAMLESEQVAIDVGACALRLNCTSAFTAMGVKKLNYKKLYGVKYKDLPFDLQPEPPHVEAGAYIKVLCT